MIAMNEKLVSIITPCYNGEKFIHRYLDSLLEQTYSNIEFIFINDGSTDNTEEIVFKYKDKFNKKGIKFIYIYQKNGGQSSAINKGLKIFKGDYLTWPDSDDILDKNNIKHKVEYFEKHLDVDILICKTHMLDSEDLSKEMGIYSRIPPKEKDNLFMDLVLEKNVYFAPGAYMLRSNTFLKLNPKRHIYDGWAGQNYQLLLPISYYGKCGYLDEYLYYYLVRSDSHSRQDTEFEKLLSNIYQHEICLTTVIKEMNLKEEKALLEIIKLKYMRRRLELAYTFKNMYIGKEQYDELKKYTVLSRKDKRLYYRIKFPILDISIKLIKRVFMMLKGRKESINTVN